MLDEKYHKMLMLVAIIAKKMSRNLIDSTSDCLLLPILVQRQGPYEYQRGPPPQFPMRSSTSIWGQNQLCLMKKIMHCQLQLGFILAQLIDFLVIFQHSQEISCIALLHAPLNNLQYKLHKCLYPRNSQTENELYSPSKP